MAYKWGVIRSLRNYVSDTWDGPSKYSREPGRHLSNVKQTLEQHSIESWLVDRDPYFMADEKIPKYFSV